MQVRAGCLDTSSRWEPVLESWGPKGVQNYKLRIALFECETVGSCDYPHAFWKDLRTRTIPKARLCARARRFVLLFIIYIYISLPWVFSLQFKARNTGARSIPKQDVNAACKDTDWKRLHKSQACCSLGYELTREYLQCKTNKKRLFFFAPNVSGCRLIETEE